MPEPTRRVALLAAAGGVLALAGCSAALPGGVPAPRSSSPPAPFHSTPAATTGGFDRRSRSIDDDASLWVVVNKRRPLEAGYTPDVVPVPVPHTNPPLLTSAASAAVAALFAAARRDGIELASNSTFRSYSDQRSVYDGNLRRLGRAAADRLTAHPGCSEHQTGLAVDIGPLSGRCSLDVCMGETPEGRWLAAHAWEHGFLLRYPSDRTAVTGYQYEPWHFRFLGLPLARELHRTGVATLEEFFGLPAAPDYG